MVIVASESEAESFKNTYFLSRFLISNDNNWEKFTAKKYLFYIKSDSSKGIGISTLKVE